MSQLERIYKLDRMLRRKQPPAKREILRHFEISQAQFKRDLDFMRDRLGAPITFDAETGGYEPWPRPVLKREHGRDLGSPSMAP
jgi:predicted DNA-binding transcriptional regulator YafY